ncbi:hypothetical protein [Leminorella grimontii]|uniref:hypothetical protein n=1 Tax=Leminorella grimontii TaxID=82981 RepID=UPI00321FB23D
MRTAVEVLRLNIKFWVEQCGCNPAQLAAKIENWQDFAFSLAEIAEAKQTIHNAH